jgi:hypothetical protein
LQQDQGLAKSETERVEVEPAPESEAEQLALESTRLKSPAKAQLNSEESAAKSHHLANWPQWWFELSQPLSQSRSKLD